MITLKLLAEASLAFAICIGLLSLAINILANRWRAVAALCGMTLAQVALFAVIAFPAVSLWLRYPECRHAPRVVEFTQGMTLCPGQAAIMPLITVKPKGEDI